MDASWDVVVLGAGAAGPVAAFRAAEMGCRVLLLEKNRRPGVKILMSGGTRCNLTHDCDERGGRNQQSQRTGKLRPAVVGAQVSVLLEEGDQGAGESQRGGCV